MRNETHTALRLTRVSATALINATQELCALDSVAGDGDHGFAMAAASNSILLRLDRDPPTSVGQLFSIVAVEFSSVGGSMGAILSVAAEAISKGLNDPQFGAGTNRVAAMLGLAQTAITEFGGAKPGDKTIVDALDAARITSLSTPSAQPTAITLRQSADAAQAAVAATSSMVAKVGRASRLGEIARGSADAGATSFAIVMAAMADEYQAGENA